MAISSAGLALLLAATPAAAQSNPSDPPSAKTKTTYYGREPVTSSAAPAQAPVPPSTPALDNSPPMLPVLPQPAPVSPPPVAPVTPPLPTVQTPPQMPPAPPKLPAAPLPLPAAPTPLPLPAAPVPLPKAAPLTPSVSVPPIIPVAPLVPADKPTVKPPAPKPGPGEGSETILVQGPGGMKDNIVEKAYRLDFTWPPNAPFRLESDTAWMERMRQESRTYEKLGKIQFPPEPDPKELYVAREFPPMHETVESNYVCYQRLYFEQINFERYGWDLGPVTPVVSAGKFFWDLAWLPYNMGTDPFRCYECNAGYCLPGDPVPLLLYPPQLSFSGLAAEAAAVTGAFFIFP